MGFAVSYVAFSGTPARRVLEVARLREVGNSNSRSKQPLFQIAELPTGWTLLLVDDERYASDDRLQAFSADHALLGCQVEEHATWSAAACYVRGHRVWRVSHTNERGDFDLQAEGDLPPEFPAIRRSLEQKQREFGKREGVSYMFDIPVRLVEVICGFRYDLLRFSWGVPEFREVAPASQD